MLDHTVPTPGVLCGDFHVHTHRSFDAEDDARLKVRAAAAAGLDFALRSEHEYVADFEPLIAELGLGASLFGVVSLELTTFVYGHFGVFPLDVVPGMRNGGAVEWVDNKGAGDCYSRDWCALEYQDLTNPNGASRLANYPGHNILPFTRTVTATQTSIINAGPLRGTTFTAAGQPRPFDYGLVFPTNSTFMYGGEGDNGFIGAPLLVWVLRHLADLERAPAAAVEPAAVS